MSPFELILEYGNPTAAILLKEVTSAQLWIIYSMLPSLAHNQPGLAGRWKVDRVVSTASQQLRRKPMLKPKGVKLAFL